MVRRLIQRVQREFVLVDLLDFKVSVHDQLDHRLGEFQKVLGVKDGQGPRLDEGQDHVDQLRGGAVAPVVVLQGVQHLAGLQQCWQFSKTTNNYVNLVQGCRHSSVDSSVPIILLPRVRVPSTPS